MTTLQLIIVVMSSLLTVPLIHIVVCCGEEAIVCFYNAESLASGGNTIVPCRVTHTGKVER